MILERKSPLTSLDWNLLLSYVVRFQTPTLISIGLETTLGCLILRNQNYFENDISVIYLTKFVFKISFIYKSVRFTKLLADVKQILTKLWSNLYKYKFQTEYNTGNIYFRETLSMNSVISSKMNIFIETEWASKFLIIVSGFINSLLSLKIWEPLNWLCYLTYCFIPLWLPIIIWT